VDLSHWGGLPELVENARRSAQTLVKAAADRLINSGHETIAEVQLGLPPNAVTKFAKRWGADLIMVGPRGLNAVTRVMLGSVAQAILRSAPCSVEIARTNSKTSSVFSPATKILLATDGSECSAAAMNMVANRAWPVGTQFKIVSVAELTIPENLSAAYSSSLTYPSGLIEELLNGAKCRAHEAVADARKILGAAGLSIMESGTVPFGDPQSVLLDEAKAWGADLIVLGSHGRHGIDRVLMGSVSESVALHAHCSVEVMRPHKEESSLKQTPAKYVSRMSA